MRKSKYTYRIYWGLLLPLVLNWFFEQSFDKQEDTPVVAALLIDGCAGLDTDLPLCTYCDEVAVEINLMTSLNGNPQDGGIWRDLDGSGLDLSNPNAVNVSALNTGDFRLRYVLENGMGCPADSAILTLNITGTDVLGCVDTVNASIDENCEFILTPENVVAGRDICFSGIEVLAFDPETGFSGNVLDASLAGKVLDVVAFHDGCPVQICNSKIELIDGQAPDLSDISWRPDTLDLLCHDLDLILENERTWNDPNYRYFLGGPIVNECTNFRLTVNDNVVYPDCDSIYAKLFRTFIVEDAFGNRSDTTLCAIFDYINPEDASKIDDIVIDECQPEGILAPPTYPFVINAFGDTVLLTENGCDYSIGFDDREFDVCGFSRKIERQIKFFNWCTDEVIFIDTLVIKVGDFSAPTISNNNDTVTIGTSPFACGTSIGLRETDLERTFGIEIEDCNEIITASGKLTTYLPNENFLDSSFQAGPSFNNGFNILNIPVGLHRLILTLSDGCKEESIDTIFFRVEDVHEPIMKCVDGLIVAMSQGPYAQVAAVDIDEGSTDNCGIREIKVRKQVAPAAYDFYDYNLNGIVLGEELDSSGYTRFDDARTDGDYVEFYCPDLETPEQDVELWAWDAEGNRSTCWSRISLEDKILPRCTAPADTVIACYDFDMDDLSLLGMPSAGFQTCGIVEFEELDSIAEVDKCGIGLVLRQFRAYKNRGTDQERVGPICIQTIYIEPIHDYHICFPEDVEAACGEDPNIPVPEMSGAACELFAVSEMDEQLFTANEECYKLLRTYSVINWCEYEDQPNPIIISRDVDQDGLPGDEGVCVIVRPNQITYLDRNDNERDIIPNLKGYWVNSQEDVSLRSIGYWQYTQHIKVFDDTPPQISFDPDQQFDSYTENSDEACLGAVDFQFTVDETCDNYLNFTVFVDEFDYGFNYLRIPEDAITGTFPNYTISGDFPIGRHSFVLEVDDGCGNQASVRMPFEVIDIYGPAPICADVILVELSLIESGEELIPYGQVQADAFVRSPVFDCSGQGRSGLIEDYSINLLGDSVLRNQTLLEFSCADKDLYLPVEIHAWDDANNHDYCRTFVQIQDNNDVCSIGAQATVSGSIHTPEGRMVEKVRVFLSGNSSKSMDTQEDGTFYFDELSKGNTYTIQALKDDDPRNGVSTFDLIALQRHIIGEKRLTDPYKLIAADVNNSKSVSTIDMIQLRKLILNVNDHFVGNLSWRFVEADYQFPDKENPWLETFPETKEVKDMKGDDVVNFIAIKIGDINGNVQANSIDQSTVNRTNEALVLQLEERMLYPGNNYPISLSAAQLKDFDGFQGTLNFASAHLKLTGIDYHLLQPGQIGLFPEQGFMTFSWNKEQEALIEANVPLFTLNFAVEKEILVSEIFSISSDYTESEAYHTTEGIANLKLSFWEPSTEGVSPLQSLAPNPFSEQIIMTYSAEQNEAVQVQVMSLSGQIIWQDELIHNTSGTYELRFNADQFPAHGVYLVNLKTKGEVFSKKVVFQ